MPFLSRMGGGSQERMIVFELTACPCGSCGGLVGTSSGVRKVRIVLNGPIPTLVLAAMLQRYVVYGLKVVTVTYVIDEFKYN